MSKGSYRRAFHVMTKPRGPICNLDCRYCYYLEKESLYPDSDFRMSENLLAEYTRQYIEAQKGAEITFAWQGGEPTLMGLDFFRRALRYQAQYRPSHVRITNTIQTNGVTLDDEWCGFFKENGFLVGISIDGPRHLHDAYRPDKGGSPTFDHVMQGLRLLQKYDVEYNVLTTVHTANADHPLTVYHFLRDEVGTTFMQFIPVVERVGQTSELTEHSVGAAQYGAFLSTIFDEWVRQDVGHIFVQIFDVALATWLGDRPGLCIFEPTCGTALAMEHNGDVYSCDHFVEPAYHLGNIMDVPLDQIATGHQQTQFGTAKRDTLPDQCLNCEVRFICNGGCPKNRFIHTDDGQPGLNYLCTGYRHFFNHISEPMTVMANLLRRGQAPAHVMAYMAEKDASLSSE